METAVENLAPNVTSRKKELLGVIIGLVNPDLVYISTGNYPSPIITVLITTEHKNIPGDLITSLSKAFEKFPDLNHRTYKVDYTTEELKKGNLYFLRNCLYGRLLYHREDFLIPAIFKDADLEEAIQKVRKWFHLEMEKISSFKEGAYFYKKKKRWNQAAYLVHQTLELLYRCFENIEIRKSKTCHIIANHRDYLDPFILDEDRLFRKNDMEDGQLLVLLDKAYCDSRYTNSYSIHKREVKLLLKKAEIMEFRVREIFLSRLEECNRLKQEERSKDEKQNEMVSIKPTKHPEELLKESLEEKLKEGFHMLKPHHLYKGKFKPDLLYMNGYGELLFTIRSLLYLCITTLQYADFKTHSPDRNPKNHIEDVLELIARMIPIEEGELLDELREMVEGKEGK